MIWITHGGTNLKYVVHSSEQASGLVMDTKLKPCVLRRCKGVTFRVSTTVLFIATFYILVTFYFISLRKRELSACFNCVYAFKLLFAF